MKIGNYNILLDPFKDQEFPKGEGRILAIGKDKRHAEFYGKFYWTILVRYKTGIKEMFTFNYKNICIENKQL